MTIVGLFCGESINALAVDATSAKDNAGKLTLFKHDKMRLTFEETYITGVGGSSMVDSVYHLVSWMDPVRPRLVEAGWFHAVLAGIERILAIAEAHEGAPQDPGEASLAVCTRTDVFYWRATFDAGSRKFERPEHATVLKPGEAVVMWASVDAPINGVPVNPSDPIALLIDLMGRVDSDRRSNGFKLPYDFDRRCSGVVLPRDGGPIRRLHPFDGLPEQLAKYKAGPGLRLLDDPEFLKFPYPK